MNLQNNPCLVGKLLLATCIRILVLGVEWLGLGTVPLFLSLAGSRTGWGLGNAYEATGVAL